MKKFLQEVIYWFSRSTVPNKEKETDISLGAMLFMITLWFNLTLILFVVQLLTNIPIADYFGNLILANRDPSDRVAVQKYKLILFYLPFVLLFSYIFYKIIFYKTNIKKAITYYDNLPKKRRRKGLWLTNIYIASSVILMGVFGYLLTEKKDRLHQKVEDQKVDTAIYLDRLPDEANLLLPKKDTTK